MYVYNRDKNSDIYESFSCSCLNNWGNNKFLSNHEQILKCNVMFTWRRQWHPTLVFLPGKSHGRRSLVGCSPWGLEESDTIEQLHFHFHFHALEKEMATHSSVLAWRIPGTEEPGGLPSMGSHRVRHYWSDLAAAAVSTLVTSGCHNQLPQTEWRKTTEIYSLTVLEAKSWKSRCLQGWFPL